VQSRRAGEPPKTEQLSFSDDDAMSPKIAAGPGGQVTVTYYEWAWLWGSSRDRNIFARTYDPAQRAWGPEVEVSPHVSEVEDHTDPDVAFDRQGNPCIVWSYDYHPHLYKKPLDAAQPTIFAARPLLVLPACSRAGSYHNKENQNKLLLTQISLQNRLLGLEEH
jgi:hypothetical protein